MESKLEVRYISREDLLKYSYAGKIIEDLREMIIQEIKEALAFKEDETVVLRREDRIERPGIGETEYVFMQEGKPTVHCNDRKGTWYDIKLEDINIEILNRLELAIRNNL